MGDDSFESGEDYRVAALTHRHTTRQVAPFCARPCAGLMDTLTDMLCPVGPSWEFVDPKRGASLGVRAQLAMAIASEK